MIRKNTRFRLYLAFLSVVYVVGVFFLLNRQAAAYSRRMERLESEFAERLQRFERSPVSSDLPASASSLFIRSTMRGAGSIERIATIRD